MSNKIIKKFLFFAIKILFFYIILEIIIRVFFLIFNNIGIVKILNYTIKIDKYFNVPDLHYGFKQAPNIDFVFNHPEFRYRVKTIIIGNDKTIGFRDDGVDNEIYALAIGDSFTWGVGVELEQVWTEILEKKLEKDVINMGLNGFQPQTYLKLVEKYVPELNPKVVFFCVNAWDKYDAVIFDKWENSGILKYINTAKDTGGGRLSGVKRLLKRISYLYLLYSYFKNIYFPYKYGWKTQMLDNKSYLTPSSLIYHLDFSNPTTKKGWEILKEVILKAKEICKSHNVRFILVIIPYKEEIYVDEMKKLYGVSIDFLNQSMLNIVKLCKENNIEFIDLTKPLRERAKKGEFYYFSIDGHWNVEGNLFVGSYIANYLQRNTVENR